ncbi:hypothetical protein ZWY2020_020012 [Hordeum vulgare]|nr:hypothetical protein ZWY2020_020011 [Hordeum vulgare]KAI4987212.1 hypothetical protein ZWY2020_020012 [Hordeum vulgare]
MEYTSSADASAITIFIAIFIAVVFFAALLRHLCGARSTEVNEHEQALTSSGCSPRVRAYSCRTRQPAAATMEVRVGPLVWAFRRADAWRRASFSVCRSDNAAVDGDFV